jgi:aldose 1-epimerase
MSTYAASLGEFQGETAVWLKGGRYEAAILPEYGGNLIVFRDVEKGYRFLHEPAEGGMEDFKAHPAIYGIPVLFPPNRFEDGKFPWNGKTYQFPINEKKNNNHIHGFVHTVPWALESYGTIGQESYVTVSLKVDEAHPAYQYFPHTFTIRLCYTLGDNGLAQHLFVKNNGTESMPCLLAFHTAVNAPFAPGSSAKDYLVKVTIGERWEMSGRMLPTGKHLPLSPEELALRDGGVYPFIQPLDNHYTVKPQQGRNFMELTDKKEDVTLVYDVGTSYKQWMIYNNGAKEGFFCPEPQINLVNAPNSELPADVTGLFGLEPGEIWEERARLYVK